MPVKVFPSILAADLSRLQEEVASVEAHADGLQIDVMDGHFVPNLSFGVSIVRSVRTRLPLDIHLMVRNPADRIAEFLALRPAIITFHAEAVRDLSERTALIAAIRRGGAQAGIALNPATPLAEIRELLPSGIDLVLLMTVEPGFAGQAFLPEVLEKVRALRRQCPHMTIEVDGGITAETASACRSAGANILVAASAVFAANDRAHAIATLRGQNTSLPASLSERGGKGEGNGAHMPSTGVLGTCFVLLGFLAILGVTGFAVLDRVSPDNRGDLLVLRGPAGERREVRVEVADDDAERMRGLMGRTSLRDGHGMLFVFPREEPRAFWMKNTLIPLDALYFNGSGVFVSSVTMMPCKADPCPSYPSAGPAQYVLEVPAGWGEGVREEWMMEW